MTVAVSQRIDDALVLEWDYDRNDDGVNPHEVAKWSWIKRWWVCQNQNHQHSYLTAPATRAKGSGCPYCSGRKVLTGFNDLATVRPELSITWDEELNGDLKPEHVSEHSHTAAWWKCPAGHSWKSAVHKRSSGIGCGYCANLKVLPGFNDLLSQAPEVAGQIDHSAQSVDPSLIVIGTHRVLGWICQQGHKWKAAVKTRTKAGHGCPYCAQIKLLPGFNDLLTVSPHVATEWDDEKNGFPPSAIHNGSKSRAWWKCHKGHSWKAIIQSRRTRGCPSCAFSGTSQSEQELFRNVSEYLEGSQNRLNVKLSGWERGVEVDVVGDWRGEKVAVEYDGSYYHSNSVEKDTSKTHSLLSAGYVVIRVREQNNSNLPRLDMDHPRLFQIEHTFGECLSRVSGEIHEWLQQTEGGKHGKSTCVDAG